MRKKVKRYLSEMNKIFSDDAEALDLISALFAKAEKLPNEEIQKTKDLKIVPSEVKDLENHFAIFCDGACRGNPGPGAWAVLGQSSLGEVLFEASGLEILTTNNKMELEGAIVALVEIEQFLLNADLDLDRSSIYLYSDSKYVIEGITKWVPGWKANQWKKADKKEPENLELWKRLDAHKEKFKKLNFLWVKGHAGHPQNERCDQLCNQALDEAGY